MFRGIFLCLIVCTLLMAAQVAHAADLAVPGGYATIQEAINAASPGDTITIAAGSYEGHLTVNKALILEGVRAGVSAIGRTGDESTIVGCLTITSAATSIKVDGLRFQAYGGDNPYGLGGPYNTSIVSNAHSTTIVNNILCGATTVQGPYTFSSLLNVTSSIINIANNVIDQVIHTASTPNAVYLTVAENGQAEVDGNEITAALGVGLGANASVTLTDNTVSDAPTEGIWFWPVSDSAVVVMTGNSVLDYDAGNGGASAVKFVSNPGSLNGKTVPDEGWQQVLNDNPGIDSIYMEAEGVAGMRVHNATANTYYATIQEAINAASPGDTIQVAAGTYEEGPSLTVPAGKDGIILNGTNATILNTCLYLHSDAVTVSGFIFQNGVLNAGQHAGIYVAANAARIIDNEFRDIKGVGGAAAVVDTYSVTDGNNMLVENNVFTGCHMGVYVQLANNVTIRNNTFTGSIHCAIGSDQVSNVTVEGNDIDASSGDRIGWEVFGSTVGIIARNNSFTGHTMAVQADGASNIDARLNWWGNPAGPGTGTSLPDTVYDPWWANEAMTILGSGGALLPVFNVTKVTLHATIQAGITNADSGNEIRVAAGTYEEGPSLTVPAGKDGIILNGTNATILNTCLYLQSDAVTVSGFIFQNGVLNAGQHAGIYVAANAARIIDNEFRDIKGVGGAAAVVDTYTFTDGNNMLVENNVFTGCHMGVYVQLASNVTIRNNTFTGSIHCAIGSDQVSNVTVEGNGIGAPAASGDKIGWEVFGSTVGIIARNNSFTGHTMAVQADGASLIDARLNWWGHASGPSGGATDPVSHAVANGSGDPISSNVRFSDVGVNAPGWLESADANTIWLNVPTDSLFVKHGETVTVELGIANIAQPVFGGQTFMAYDTSKLTAVSAAGADPWTIDPLWLRHAVSGGNVSIFFADMQSNPPTATTATVATLTFTAGSTDGTTTVTFKADVDLNETVLVGSGGYSVKPTKVNSQTIVIDGTPPVDFTPTANPPSWTNASEIAISFGTTDVTSGVKQYNIAVGTYSAENVASGCTVPTDELADGEHTVTVTAIDNAGNTQEGTVTIYIDKTKPTVTIVSIMQGTLDLLASGAVALQGAVTITVQASDVAPPDGSGLVVAPPIVALSSDTWSAVPTDITNNGSGIYTYKVVAATPNGQITVTATAADNAGNSNSDVKEFTVNKTQLAVTVQLEGLVPVSGGIVRTVTFVATGGTRAEWSVDLTFDGTDTAITTLTGVPAGTTKLSAKTAWNLRRRLAATFDEDGQGSVAFTGDSKLLGGDLTADNVVTIFDWAVLRDKWYTYGSTADINGDGQVDNDDYFILRRNWFKAGEPE